MGNEWKKLLGLALDRLQNEIFSQMAAILKASIEASKNRKVINEKSTNQAATEAG